MSVSSIIASNNKIYDNLLPNPYPYPAQPNGLGAVLQTDNRAGDQDIIGLGNLQVSVVNNPLLGGSLTIGGAGQDLRIQGATAKGSIIAGNGTSTVEIPVGVNGLVLKANSATATGLEWGTDAQGGTVMAVNQGTNINVGGTIAQPIVNLATPLTSTLGMGTVALTDKVGASGTAGQFLSAGAGGETLWATPPSSFVGSVSSGTNINVDNTNPLAPIVNFATPTTSNIEIGIGTEILATNGFTTMSIDSTGLNDTYLNGLVENKEDIAVSSTSVVETISTTDGSTYQNVSVITCNTTGVNEIKTSTNLSTTNYGSSTILCSSGSAVIGVGCVSPNSPADIQGSISIQTDLTNPQLALSQSAPFSATYSTIIDKNGIIQNNSGGVGFTIQTNSSDFNIQNTANVGIFPNNNTTIASIGTTFLNGNLIKCVKTGTGGQANPQLILENQNANGSVALEVYKNKPTASIGGDVLFNQSVYGKDGANNKQEYTRISHTVRDNTSGNEDGSIEMSCFVAGAVSTFLQLNGIENEVNCLKNLDMTGKNIITNTGDMLIQSIPSTGTGNLSVQAKGFSQFGGETGFTNLYNTNGNITLNAGGVASDLEFNCPNWQSATASGNSGQHLRIKLNGVYYKIQLLND